MDVFSHGLWGGILLGRERRSDYLLAAAFSLLPDLVGEGVMFSLAALGLDNMPSLRHGHPDISAFPPYAQNFYNASHSLVVFSVTFALVWFLRQRPFLPLAAWGIHVLIDIPTHSLGLFPTPFLWPLSDFKLDGVQWRSPVVLIPNFVLLAVLYSLWYYGRRKRKRAQGPG